jgi:uncharacterized protein (TIGR02996 family)
MPRYEFSEGNSSKFWEITLEGTGYKVRYGKIGANGQTTIKDFGSEAQANKEYDKIVAEKVKKGYALVGGGDGAKPKAKAKEAKKAPSAADPKLEAAILKDPDDPDAYLVYADWLQSKGDPIGELIVLQHQKKTAAANALIKKHKLLGELADAPPPEFKLEWQYGFIKRAEIAWPLYDRSENKDDAKTAEKKFRAFLDLPVARFIQDLHLGPAPSAEFMYLWFFAEAIEEKEPPALRKLFLGERGDWDFGHSYSKMPDPKKIRGMRSLSLLGGQIEMPSKIELPELREFSIEQQGLGGKSLKAICNATWPKLESLVLAFGDGTYGGETKPKEFQPILDAKGLPKLKHLGLVTIAAGGALIEALAKSKILKQLTSLDLSRGVLGDEHVDAMLASGAFKHLVDLDLGENYLTSAGAKKAKKIAKSVNVESQEEVDTPEERYVNVAE